MVSKRFLFLLLTEYVGECVSNKCDFTNLSILINIWISCMNILSSETYNLFKPNSIIETVNKCIISWKFLQFSPSITEQVLKGKNIKSLKKVIKKFEEKKEEREMKCEFSHRGRKLKLIISLIFFE